MALNSNFKSDLTPYRRNLLGLALIMTLSIQSAQAASTCQDLFTAESKKNPDTIAAKSLSPLIFGGDAVIRGVRLEPSRLVESVQSPRDPNYRKALSLLLRMTADSLYISGGIKVTLQKGELNLGRVLKDGSSIEFEYGLDSRGTSGKIELRKIVHYKKNGQGVTLEKSPLSDDGSMLMVEHLLWSVQQGQRQGRTIEFDTKPIGRSDVEGWAKDGPLPPELTARIKQDKSLEAYEVLQQAAPHLRAEDLAKVREIEGRLETIEVPLVIEGALLEGLRSWMGRVEVLSKPTVRDDLDRGRYRTLLLKGAGKVTWRFLVDRTAKQLGNTPSMLVLAAVLGGYMGRDGLPWISSGDEDITPVALESEPLSAEAISTFERTLHHLDPEWAAVDPTLVQEMGSRFKVQVAPDAHADLTGFRNLIGALSGIESANEGSARFYMGSPDLANLAPSQFQLETSVKSVVGQPKPGMVISQFERSQTIVLTTILQSQGAAAPSSIKSVTIRSAERPVLYERLSRRLDSAFAKAAASAPVRPDAK